MPDNKPRSRQRNITGSGSGAYKKGSGLGTGPVGNTGGHSGPSSGGNTHYTSTGPSRAVKRGGGGIGLLVVILIVYFLFFKNDSSSDYESYNDSYDNQPQVVYDNELTPYGQDSSDSSSVSSLINSLSTGSYGDMGIYTDNVYETKPEMVESSPSTAPVDDSVSSGARAKRTVIKGDGSDVVTIMVYMCGTDLESKSGMASNDLAEMARASLSDKVNILIYTGGCKGWKTSGISSKVNQIYLITKGGMKRLVDDDGNKTMTDPSTLTSFIKYCASNYPANRNELILWDHGGGSISGFGYDEKVYSSTAMDLAGIDKALTDAGVKFDFIGFDACLMATAENAIMLDDHADYLIASEETEPGIGWYYTQWLNKLSQNTGMSTLEIGKNIIDDYTSACASQCRGQKTTLSIIDLAEFADTVPDKLTAFAKSINGIISDNGFKTVSDARHSCKEFGRQSRIDQVDLIQLAKNINNSESKALADAVRSSVKYNRTSSDMTYAGGVAIYFPGGERRLVDPARTVFSKIGMNDEYVRCITDVASMSTAGQAAGGSGFGLLDMFTDSSGSDYSYGGGSADMIGSLLGSFLSARSLPDATGKDDATYDYMDDRSLDDDFIAEYVSLNILDLSQLEWKEGSDGTYRISLTDDQWDLVHDIDLNMFIDDGDGYIDLGLDNVFETDGNDMIADDSGAWLALNGQVMPYYRADTWEDGDRYSIMGYAPILLNGERAKLIIVFDDTNPNGYVAGAVADYSHEETVPTQTSAKSTVGLNVGDKIQFVCDYYTYDLKYQDSYMFGEEITVTDDLKVSDVTLDDVDTIISYRFTDIYEGTYWTPAIYN